MTDLDDRTSGSGSGFGPGEEINVDTHGNVVPIDETLWERRQRVLTMRNAGATFTQIAAQVGISTWTARNDLAMALREVGTVPREEMAARQRAVLLDLQRAFYPAALGGDKDAAHVIIKALEREAKLFGVDAPARIVAAANDVDFSDRVATLITSIAEVDPDALVALTAARQAHEDARRQGVKDDPDMHCRPDPADPPADTVTHMAPAPVEDDDDDGPWSNL